MANRLKVAVVDLIDVLLDQGWSQRRIAQALGIDRGTVARYFRLRQNRESRAWSDPPQAPANAAKAPRGSDSTMN